jgi:hypothetical protein
VKLTDTVAVVPEGRSPRVQVTVFPVREHVPSVVVIVPHVIVPLGKYTSVRLTLRASDGPLLRTMIVHVAV